jgi:NAD(P)-dependent dehydrogenase (short-subunit alcohol dehydrogenase family)
MAPKGKGSIICTASVAALRSGAGGTPYSASKAGVISMVQTTAQQLGGTGIRVNAICPGLIATSIFGATMGMTRDAADQMAALVAQNAQIAQPVKKPGLPQDIAQAALYLASDASAFVTGTHLVVDGGITVGSRHSWDPEAGSPFAAIFGESLMQMAPGSGQG